MQHMVDPRQSFMFDPAESMFSPMVLDRLRKDWPEVVRHTLLQLMPAVELSKHFHPVLGCPTKELYGMAGAIFLREYFNLTIAQAVDRCLFDAQWHYALNLTPATVSMGHATIERYLKLMAEDGLARTIFQRVTEAFVKALGLEVSRQRLDSTHIQSDMASFGRTRLMAVTIKRFLVQLKRHEAERYGQLPAELLERYAPAESQMFGRYEGDRKPMRQTMAEDMLSLVTQFATNAAVTARTSYQAMVRVLDEQCDVQHEKVVVKKPEGGDVLQNPSDPEASFSGHKGVGYSVQITQTCTAGNDAQLITAINVTGAHVSDQKAVAPMLEQLAEQGLLPEVIYADTGYGADENVQHAQQLGVDLQAPVVGQAPAGEPDGLTVDDFAIDEASETVQLCPAGCTPVSSLVNPNTGQTRTVMANKDCGRCPFRKLCPIKKIGGQFVLIHTAVQRRCADRRAEQATKAFVEHYAIRSGLESTNSALKRTLGLARLRVRGLLKMTMGVLLRCAGWNMKRATAALVKRARRAGTDLRAVLGALSGGLYADHARLFAAGALRERFATDPTFRPLTRRRPTRAAA